MAKTTKDIVTYPALNGALTKVKNKLQEQIKNAGGGHNGSDWFNITINRTNGVITVTRNPYTMTPDLWTTEPPEEYTRFRVYVKDAITGYTATSKTIATILSVEYDKSFLLAFEIGSELFNNNPALVLVRFYKNGSYKGGIVNLTTGLDVTINNTSVKASDGLIELKQGNASLTMQGNAIAADLGSNTTVNAKAGEVTLKQGDAMVQLKGEGVLLKQDLSKVQIAGNEIHAAIWEGEAAEVYLRIAPDGIWIRSGLVQENQFRLLRLDKLLSAGFFDW